MNPMYNSRLLRFTGLILAVLVWLANSDNPPTGKTGAPFDGNCNECHSGGNFDGTVTVDGLPSTIEPNTTYPLMITLTPTSGSPVRGGFQLVSVDANNNNAGDLTPGNAQSGTEFLSGREYLEHRGAKIFTGGGPASWSFNWKSPVTAAGNTITMYFIGNFTNGNNQETGDIPIAFSNTYGFNGAPPVTVTISNINNVSCFGGNNGTATAEPDGGVPPYSYHWSNNQTGQTAINLTAGTYTVTVTGSSGSGTATATAVITQPPILNATASVLGVITCADPSVTATATASGGTSPYFYNWSNGATTQQTELTMPGGYSVTVTDDNGCTKVAFVTVNSNTNPPNVEAGPTGTIDCVHLTTTLDGTGSSQGPTFSYQWTASNGGNIIAGATTLFPIVNAAGTYTLVVTNNGNGCTASDFTTVTSTIQPPTVSTTGGQLTCVVSSVTLTTTTNASPATFSWVGPGGFSSTEQNPMVSASGTYTVTVTNTSTGCTASATASVTQNTTPPTATATSGGTLTCWATSVPVNGGSNAPNATFSWAGPGGFMSSLQNPVVTSPGTYTVTVTNPANGCTATATAQVAQNITPPTASATATQITCTNTSSQLNATTNASPAGYSWSGPNGFTSTLQNPTTTTTGVYSVVVTDSLNGCTATATASVTQNTTPPVASAGVPGNLNCTTFSLELNGTGSSQGSNFAYLWTTVNGHIVSGATTLTPTVDSAGLYVLTVTNTQNGCTASASATVVQSPAVSAGISIVSPVSCNGNSDGALTANGGGGNGMYTYSWSTGDDTASIANLPAGAYTVTITDGEDCTATASGTITEPVVLAANATATGETSLGANDGTATAAPTGGTPGYTYLWNNSETTAMITGLAPGNYTVTVTDENNCTAVQTVTVNSFNCSIAATISATNVTCNGAANGMATVNLTGATQPVSYLWSNGDTTASISGLAPGTYTVEVTDANNCPAQATVFITQPAPLLANASATPETGLGLNNGTATSSPTGGTSPYTFAWSNGQNTQTITGLAPGSYTVTVTDTKGCTIVRTVVVNAFNCALTVTVSHVNVSCAGGADGQATAVPAGATQPVSYAWSNGGSTATISNLAATTYTVSVTDGAGCVSSSMVTISEPALLTSLVESLVNVSCPEDKTGAAVVVPVGGTSPYQIDWPGGSGGQNLGVGTYTVSISDANGCSTTQVVTIASFDSIAPQITCPSISLVYCAGTTVQYMAPVVSDNCSLNGAQPELISGLPSGSVFPSGETVQVFRITDNSGNSSTCSFSIVVGPPIIITLDSVTPDINDAGVGTIDVSVSGATGNLMYTWISDGLPFASTEDLTGLHAGEYTLVVTDSNGCTATLASVKIDNTVGTNDPGNPVSVRVIPNPVRTTLHLEIRGFEPAAVQMLDMHGRLIRNLDPGEWTNELDVATLPGGMYYLKVMTAKGSWKVVKWVKAD